jgi:hypothetical protein
MSILQAELLLYRDILASPLLTDATVRADIINLREQTLGKNIDAFTAQQTAWYTVAPSRGAPSALAGVALASSKRATAWMRASASSLPAVATLPLPSCDSGQMTTIRRSATTMVMNRIAPDECCF